MVTRRFKIDTQQAEKVFKKAPDLLHKHLRNGLDRSAGVVINQAQQLAPYAGSELVRTISYQYTGPLRVEVFAAKQYARYVEEGTGPGGMPPLYTLRDWIRARHITPRDPNMSENQLAYIIGRSITARGTPAQPFMEPSLERSEARIQQLLNAATAKALAQL